MTREAECSAWLFTGWSIQQLRERGAEMIPNLSLHDIDAAPMPEFARVGVAMVSVEIDSDEKIIASTVAGLRAEIAEVRANAERKAVALTEKINQLLAIGYTPTSAVEESDIPF